MPENSQQPIRKFEEIGGIGNRTGRMAFVVDEKRFNAEVRGHWREVAGFDEKAELGRSSGLKPILDSARRRGYRVNQPDRD